MILATLLLLQAAPAPTFSEAILLSPRQAGELLLKGQDHGQVEEARLPPDSQAAPPGTAELQLLEKPSLQDIGCTRRRWTVKFRHPPEANRDSATVSDSYSSTEVALAISGACPEGRYMHLNPGLEAAPALAALARLQRIRSGETPASFSCTDSTSSNFCADNAAIRQALDRLTPWAASLAGERFRFWLGTPGQVVTEILLGPEASDPIVVDRRFPAPF